MITKKENKELREAFQQVYDRMWYMFGITWMLISASLAMALDPRDNSEIFVYILLIGGLVLYAHTMISKYYRNYKENEKELKELMEVAKSAK
jgi:positive regulator of sigma E activity